MYRSSLAHRYIQRSGRTGVSSFSSLFSTLSLMLSVSRERQELRTLSDAALKDMGLDRADVAREVAKSMWDLPADRMQ